MSEDYAKLPNLKRYDKNKGVTKYQFHIRIYRKRYKQLYYDNIKIKLDENDKSSKVKDELNIIICKCRTKVCI